MQDRHDDFGRRHLAPQLGAHLRMLADRNAAAIVGYRHRAIGVDRHGDVVGMARQGFVDGVVDDFEHHVVQARAVVHVADVHAGALADRFQTFQCGDAVGVVRIAVRCRRGRFVGHSLRVGCKAGVASPGRWARYAGQGIKAEL